MFPHQQEPHFPENNVDVNVQELEEEPDSDDEVLKITVEGVEYTITRKAEESMMFAIDTSRTPPTPFYRFLYAAEGAVDNIGADLLEFHMPTEDVIASVDWENVDAADSKTHPKAVEVSDEVFAKVRGVYLYCKAKKDKKAKAKGLPNAGVPMYSNFKVKWLKFRNLCMVYKCMNPSMANETVMDTITGRLKMLPSVNAVAEAVAEDIAKFLLKRKRNIVKLREKRALELELEKVAKDEDDAEKAVEEKTAAIAAAQQEKMAASQADLGTTSRSEAKQRRDETLKEIETKKVHAAEELKNVQLEQKKIIAKKKDLVKQVEKAELATSADFPEKKKVKRCDTTLLAIIPTPRSRASKDGPQWTPPKKKEGQAVSFHAPGNSWSNENRARLQLLFSLYGHLKSARIVDLPMSFRAVMEFIGGNDAANDLGFSERVFVYLVGVTLNQEGVAYGDVLAILLRLVASNSITPENVAGMSIQDLLVALGPDVGCTLVHAAGILHTAKAIVSNHGGIVPTDKAGLMASGVDETVASYLMQQVYGRTDLVIGIHTRKVVCALDMFDWEETGAKSKLDVKMVNVAVNHVKKSLATWVPAGDGILFQDAIECLGETVGKNKLGVWGRIITVVNKHFAPADKKIVTGMITNIVQFYKATKSGGKKKHGADNFA